MTPRTWAEKKIDNLPMGVGMQSVNAEAALRAIKADHARAVRIVKRAYGTTWKKQDYVNEAYREGRLHMAQDILAALQRGRTGRGK